MITKRNTLKLSILITLLIGCIGFTTYSLLKTINNSTETQYIYIDNDDTIDSLFHKNSQADIDNPLLFRLLTKSSLFNLKTGKYAIPENCTTIQYFRNLRSGLQTPVKLRIPSTWTVEQVAKRIASQIMLDSATIMECLTDTNNLNLLGCTKETLPAIIIPNTYEVWWNIAPQQLVYRLKREHADFWNDQRCRQAEALGLSKFEVHTLASIVCRETNDLQEMPVIAGLYYNRLQRKRPLQACPTVIFARQDFSITRLTTPLDPDSPYNTYRYAGLPPGPIFIAPIVAIDAVLQLKHHNYLYMCAKEDFSGTHRFAATYAEHQRNAMLYKRAYKKRFGKKP